MNHLAITGYFYAAVIIALSLHFVDVVSRVSGQLPPRQLPPRQLPPDKYPPDNYPLGQIPPGQLPPPEKFFKHLPWYSLYLYSSYSFLLLMFSALCHPKTAFLKATK